MKHHRPKQPDWSKQFKFIERRDEFLKMDTNDTQQAAPRNDIEKKKENKQATKQDIVVSKYELISRINKISNDHGIPLNYIRITSRFNLPKVDRYEMGEVDYIFLQSNENKYLYGGRKALTVELLERAIVELELMTGKESTVIPKNNESKLRALFEKEFDYVLKMDNSDEFVRLVYNHWRSRRQELKAPLLRVLWKPNPEDSSHYLAFRPREKQQKEKKKQLRRQNKPTEQQTISNMDGLQKEFQEGLSIVERVRLRQYLKHNIMVLDIRKFNMEIKSFKEEGLFTPEFQRSEIGKHKQTIARMSKQLEARKVAEQPEEKIQEEAIEDPKTAIVNFLATLVSKSNKLSIDFDSMIYGGSKAAGPIPLLPSNSQTSYISTVPVKTESINIKGREESSNICRFNVSTLRLGPHEVLLARDFSQAKPRRDQDVEETKGISNYFSQRQKRVRSGYFFDDDEDDFKDIRKSISINFKKWKGDSILKA